MDCKVEKGVIGANFLTKITWMCNKFTVSGLIILAEHFQELQATVVEFKEGINALNYIFGNKLVELVE